MDYPQHKPSAELTVEQELADTKAALAQARMGEQQALQFLERMSHRLRTPLNGVVGMAELLTQTTLSEEQQEPAKWLNNSASLLKTQLGDVLDFVALQKNQLVLLPSRFALEGLLNELIDQARGMLGTRSINLELNKPVHLPWVYADRQRLAQILHNLLLNALTYTQAGQIRVIVDASRVQETNARLAITVQDTGCGIEAARLPYLFEPMPHDTGLRQGGLGTGLILSHKLAQAMGGSIEVASEPGKGSRFTLCVACPVAETEPLIQLTGAALASRLASLRVLVVEDHPINQQLLCSFLQKLGVEDIILADDGLEACCVATSGGIDLILMDMQMPNMDGPSAARAIRQMPLEQQPYIVALTMNAFDQDRQTCLNAGMDQFLTKPISLPRLVEVLTQSANQIQSKAVYTLN